MGNLTVKESGEMVNIISPNVSKITSFKVHFSPRQEGTGDPSPENVREITGWDGVEGYGCGKNLFNGIMRKGSYNTTTGEFENTNWYTSELLPVKPNTTYAFVKDGELNYPPYSYQFDEQKQYISNTYTTSSKIITTRNETKYIVITISANAFNKKYLDNFMICEGNNINAIRDITASTDWTEDVGTVYGGYIDLVSGELVSSWICSKIKDLDGTWNYRSSNKRFQITLQSNFANTDATAWSRFAIAEAYKKSTSDGYANEQIATYINKHIYIRDDSFDGDVEAFLEAVGDTKVAYELADPIIHQLTSQQLSTLKGQNNFWSNADYIEIEYELTETFDIQKAKRKIILNQPHVESASGDLVTFDTDMKGKLKECKVYFSPVQEGEGDPSPDNVRNIVGWNGVKVGLPDEYQEVEYIESTGTQYIDTGVTLGTNDFTILFNFGQTKRTSGEQPITSIWTSEYNYWNLFIRSVSSNKFVLDVYTSAHHMLSTEVNLNEKYDVSLIKNGNLWELKQKDSTITWTYSSSKINNTTLKLFKRGDLSTGHSTHIKMYSFKMTISNTRTLNLIPCYRKSDGEIGMYDTISKQFFTNQGTDTFLKGDDVDGIQANIDWTDSTGTVYGGYVDLVSGELVQEYWGFTADGENVKANSQYKNENLDIFGAGIVYNNPTGIGANSWREVINVYCNKIPVYTRMDNTKNIPYLYVPTAGALYMVFYVGKISEHPEIVTKADTLEFVNNWLKENPLQLVYQLKDPIHYQLTPQQLSALKGINNVYSNTNGQTEIKYWKH